MQIITTAKLAARRGAPCQLTRQPSSEGSSKMRSITAGQANHIPATSRTTTINRADFIRRIVAVLGLCVDYSSPPGRRASIKERMLAAENRTVKRTSSCAIATKVATVATRQSKNNSKSCLTDYTLDRDARSQGLGFHAALTYVESWLRNFGPKVLRRPALRRVGTLRSNTDGRQASLIASRHWRLTSLAAT